ncbi:hypothetical protein HDU87_001900 [Geranomyces variabilis]|uniref:Uncharacterized protein n=1 Tax=Geranomyces variabilis TaxID=109894 RepID=A0AAD5TCE4_9FUNG|nr:hypothetical protein HDU87_001900 [Geranomyces variabilis]
MEAAGVMSSPNIDVFSDHYYNAMGTNDWLGRAVNGSDIFANRAQKVYYIGEFGFGGQVTCAHLLDQVVPNKQISGAGPLDLASNADEIMTVKQFHTAAAQINGIAEMIPFPPPAAPYMKNITDASRLTWIGSAGPRPTKCGERIQKRLGA